MTSFTVNRRALTHRELEVTARIVNGLGNKEIARDLAISLQTVKNHVTRIMSKVGVNNRTQVAVWGVRHGLGPHIILLVRLLAVALAAPRLGIFHPGRLQR